MWEGIATRVGKAGTPVGNSYWERCSRDRGIQQAVGEDDRRMRHRGPRTEGVGEVHIGMSRHLFHPDQIINGNEDDE
jgi:hypothetical protein